MPLPSTIDEQKSVAIEVQNLMKELECTRVACKDQLEAIKASPRAILRKALRLANNPARCYY